MFGSEPAGQVVDELAMIVSDFHPADFRLMATSLAQADTRELVGAIDVPTKLIWGDGDARSPLHVSISGVGA